MKTETVETICPVSQKEWRRWLTKNHGGKQSVWVIFYKKNSGMPAIPWSDAVDEALCFGWVDSKRKSIDADRFMQFFSKRKPMGTWSRINKKKVEKLINAGLMTQAGLDCIAAAKLSGSWEILDDVEALKIPADLNRAFKGHAGARRYFMRLPRSDRRNMLLGLVLAKKAETRARRINDIVLKTTALAGTA